MSPARCPSCQGPVDPLLAPAPLIRGSRVVMCCSDACREALRTGRGEADSLAAPEPAIAPPAGAGTPEAASAQTALTPGEAARDDLHPEAAADALAASDTPVEAGTGIPADRRLLWRGRRRALLVVLGVGFVLAAVLVLWKVAARGQEHADASEDGAARGTEGPRPPGRPDAPSARPVADRSPLRRKPSRPTRLSLAARSGRILTRYLGSRVVRYRLTAADVLAEAGKPEALTVLQADLASPLWSTQLRAAEALARRGAPEGLEALRAQLRSRRPSLRTAAAFALARQGDASGAPLLRRLARIPKRRLACHAALARLGNPASLRYLRAVLSRSRAPDERIRAAIALGLAGERDGLSILQAQLHKPGIQLGVALALERLEAPEAGSALRRALDHEALRIQAARLLRRRGIVPDLRPLTRDLASRSDESRLTAAGALLLLADQSRAEAP